MKPGLSGSAVGHTALPKRPNNLLSSVRQASPGEWNQSFPPAPPCPASAPRSTGQHVPGSWPHLSNLSQPRAFRSREKGLGVLSGTASQHPTLTRALHWTPAPPNAEAVQLPPLTPNNGKMEAVAPQGRRLGPSPPSAEPTACAQPWLLSPDLGVTEKPTFPVPSSEPPPSMEDSLTALHRQTGDRAPPFQPSPQTHSSLATLDLTE